MSLPDEGIATLGARGAVAYRVSGPRDAEPLLLLRPFGGSMALWGGFAAALEREHRVIAFDPRGVGRSDDAPPRCSTRGMARDAVALLDALEVPRAHVFGLSLGGMVASWMAIDAAARIDRLVLASTLPRAGAISRRVLGEATSFLRWFVRPGVAAEVGLVRQVLSPRFRTAHRDRVREIAEAVRAHPTRRANLLRLAMAAATHDAEPRLAEVVATTLLLVGQLDPLVGARSQSELLLGIPHARLESLRDTGHDLTLERPDETAARTLAFLDDRAHDGGESAMDFLQRR